MQIPHDSVVLVADGAKLLFFRNAGDAGHPNLIVEEAEQQADASDRDIKSDAAGRAHGPAGGGASIGEADYHQQAEDRFAVAAAELLNARASAGAFDSLVVVAPPKTLGALRKHYGKAVESRLTGELAKDLTGHSVARITAALAAA